MYSVVKLLIFPFSHSSLCQKEGFRFLAVPMYISFQYISFEIQISVSLMNILRYQPCLIAVEVSVNLASSLLISVSGRDCL